MIMSYSDGINRLKKPSNATKCFVRPACSTILGTVQPIGRRGFLWIRPSKFSVGRRLWYSPFVCAHRSDGIPFSFEGSSNTFKTHKDISLYFKIRYLIIYK